MQKALIMPACCANQCVLAYHLQPMQRRKFAEVNVVSMYYVRDVHHVHVFQRQKWKW